MNHSFEVSVSNLGRIANAKINISPLTIIVGNNSTGKSFITKTLYCILNTLNKNHMLIQIQKTEDEIRTYLSLLHSFLTAKQKADIKYIEFADFVNEVYIPFLRIVIDEIKDKSLFFAEKIISNNRINFIELDKRLRGYLKEQENLPDFVTESKNSLQHNIESLKQAFLNTGNFLSSQTAEYLANSLRKNFQHQDISQLISFGASKAVVSLQDIGLFEIKKNQGTVFKFSKDGLIKASELKNVVYLDSPIYLNLKNALSKIKKENIVFGTDALKGYPAYVDELFSFLDVKTVEQQEERFSEISRDIENIVHGKLQKNELGDFEFIENNKKVVPLPLLATSVASISLIEYLIRNNIISRGSFLIIDEPESHLHPEWQVELSNILYKIAQTGANVIISTHSINIIKAVKVILKEDAIARDLISINKTPYDPEFHNMDILEKVEKSLKELTDPYSNLVWRSL